MALGTEIWALLVAREGTLFIAVVFGVALLNQVFTILRQQWVSAHAA